MSETATAIIFKKIGGDIGTDEIVGLADLIGEDAAKRINDVVYVVCSHDIYVPIALQKPTKTVDPHEEEPVSEDGTISSRLYTGDSAASFEKAALRLAEAGGLSVEDAIYRLSQFAFCGITIEEMACNLRKFLDELDEIAESLQAEGSEGVMMPHRDKIIISILALILCRELRELYGQGVDAGPVAARPGLIRSADDGPWRAETGA